MFSISAETVNLQVIDGSTIRHTLGHLRLPWWWRLGHRLLAARCVFCNRRGDLGDIDLCEACLHALPWSVAQAVPTRGGAVSGGAVSGGAVSGGAVSAAVTALFDYRPPVSTALIQLKFHADFRYAAVLGTLLGLSSRQAWAESCAPRAGRLVPVPLHPHRLCERGFNQVAWIVRYASHVSGWPIEPRLLQRVRPTQAQTRLDARARRLNLKDAFQLGSAASEPSPASTSSMLILIDDVVTTGATLEAASAVLQAAGEVQPWAVARAMPANMTSPMV